MGVAALRVVLAVLSVDVGETLSVGVVADEVVGEDFTESVVVPLGVDDGGTLQ